jgi:ferredoxin
MKVVVNFDVCASTGTCTNIAPEIFEIRADGYLYLLNDYDQSLPPELAAKANEAAELCPTGAISIEDEGAETEGEESATPA